MKIKVLVLITSRAYNISCHSIKSCIISKTKNSITKGTKRSRERSGSYKTKQCYRSNKSVSCTLTILDYLYKLDLKVNFLETLIEQELQDRAE
jgi:tRNA/tmRNA/rRNA uracil-C5-methylase (TrmA/RlmC/RlmD family)